MKKNILGIGVDDLTMDEAVLAALALMDSHRGAYAVTPNAEILLACRNDPAAAEAVNGADLVLADGVGVLYAARILGLPLRERVSGSDLTPRLLEALAQRGGSVFLLGARPGVGERAAARLEEMYPNLRILGTEHGYFSDDAALWERIRALAPDLLLVCLGAPKQEKWMRRHAGEPAVGLMIGLGGVLDLLAGETRRAPEAWRKGGLEWLYRLLREPQRLPRMVRLPRILLLAAEERIRSGRGKP